MRSLEEKHHKEGLETQIKNLNAELKHMKEEYEYVRQAAAESSLKLACICSDYETNQMALMKRNRTMVDYAKKLLAFMNSVDQTVTSEKIKSSNLTSTLKSFKELPTLL